MEGLKRTTREQEPDRKTGRKRLDWALSPVEVAGALRGEPGLVFLDSATAEEPGDGARGEYSMVAVRPERVLRGNLSDAGDRGLLRQALGQAEGLGGADADVGVPCGGLFGMVDYDGRFEFGDYSGVWVYEHGEGSWWACGELPEVDLGGVGEVELPEVEFRAEMERGCFLQMVERAKAYIAAGDIYQVNLSQRFVAAWQRGADAWGVYRALREASPAPYGGYFNLGERQGLSSSPELFLRLSGRSVTTRPIKGTRPRFPDLERDERSAYDLITSAKEIAELVMITDLERNDLGQVCEWGSVEVTELLKLERFAQVFHLVSTVGGTVREGIDQVEVLARCFPGGSITGAPKKRSMEVIEELEPVERGLYTGAMGYLGRNGECQLSIAIRTAVVEGEELRLQTGAGIVADSEAEAEYEETLHKAAGFFRAVEAAGS